MSEWISIEERLPDIIGSYLAWDGASLMWSFFNSCNQWCGDNEYYENATHWMPLPKPPTATGGNAKRG